MAFSEINEAVALTGTEYDATVVESLRDAADGEITEILEANNIAVPTIVPGAIKRASIMWTCRNILARQKMDGTTPDIVRAGNYYEDISINDSILDYQQKGMAAVLRYIRGLNYDPLVEIG